MITGWNSSRMKSIFMFPKVSTQHSGGYLGIRNYVTCKYSDKGIPLSAFSAIVSPNHNSLEKYCPKTAAEHISSFTNIATIEECW